METTTHQTGSLVTVKSVAGQLWQARYVRTTSDGLIVIAHNGHRYEINPDRVVSIGTPSDCAWC